MIKNLIVLIKLFLLFEFSFVTMGVVICGFLNLLIYIQDSRIDIDIFYIYIKTMTFYWLFLQV